MAVTKYYLTKAGLKRIEEEYGKLSAFKKSKMTGGDVPATWHSEEVNPDYLAYQEDMTLLESRLSEYENILNNMEIIKAPAKLKQSEIGLGATVLCEIGGVKDEFTIVGPLESNPGVGRISHESPVGKALIGHRKGEDVTVQSSVHVTYKILKISYK